MSVHSQFKNSFLINQQRNKVSWLIFIIFLWKNFTSTVIAFLICIKRLDMTANRTIPVQGSRRCSISLYICHKDACRCVKPWIPNTRYFVCTGSKSYICKHLALTSKTKRYYSDLGTCNTGLLSLITAKQYRKETKKKGCCWFYLSTLQTLWWPGRMVWGKFGTMFWLWIQRICSLYPRTQNLHQKSTQKGNACKLKMLS